MNFNTLTTQRNFAEQVCLRLEQCVIKTHIPFLANFRCHICGDSQRNKFKKRGYIIEKPQGLSYTCHNCSAGFIFRDYLEVYHNDLFRQFTFETLKDYRATHSDRSYEKPVSQPADTTTDYLHTLERLSDCSPTHPARIYADARRIPSDQISRLYYTDRFYKYINSSVEGKFTHIHEQKYEHGRLILPMYRRDKTVFGVIGRALDPANTMRYITIKFDPNHPKFFGLDRLDMRKHAYALEGPIDSLFLPNAIALAGTDGSFDQIFTDKKQYTIILDNENRNADVISKYDKYISQGSSIVIWPDNITSKDINQLVLDGFSVSDVMSIVANNTVSGLSATIRFNRWKKV